MDKPVPVRRALALALHLQEKEIWIKNDELIVGNQASDLRAAPIFPEYTVTWIEQEIDDLASRPGAGFAVSEDDKRIIHEVCPFWHGLTVHDRSYGLFTDEQNRILATTLMKIEGNMNAGDGHLAVNYERVLQLGIDGFKDVVAKRRSRVDLADWEGLHQEQFLKSVAIVLDALSSYIDRYAQLASQMAEAEQRSWRRNELNRSPTIAISSLASRPRLSGRPCSFATSSNSFCRLSQTATPFRLGASISSSIRGIGAMWN